MMDKRLKEIVIYILEHSSSLEPEQRAQLEALSEKLDLNAFPLDELERSLRRLLVEAELIDESPASDLGGDFAVQEVEMEREAADYLQRLHRHGLIDREQEDELIARAARIHPEGIRLEHVQFLAASLIFDENLGAGDRGDAPGAPPQH